VKSYRRSYRAGLGNVLWVALVALTCCFAAAAGAQQDSAVQAPPATDSAHTATPAVPATEQGSQTLHLVVGHSMVIRTPTRIKRMLTGSPDVLESVVISPHEVVLTAKQGGGSSLVIWDETGKSQMLDVFADIDVHSLSDALEESYSGINVEAQSQQGKVVLVGTVPSTAAADQIMKMASSFSKDVVNALQIAAPPRQKQILLKVRIAEVDRSKLNQFGINLFSTGATNTIGTISTQQFGPVSTSSASGGSGGPVSSNFNLSDLMNIFLFRPDINLGATIKALQEKSILQILAEPNLMALSGQPAHFLAGGQFPYPIVQGVGGGTAGAVTIQWMPYGVKLEFIATIGADDTIHMKVAPEVSALDYSNTVTIQGFTMPAIQTRRADTEIELKNGQTFGIAGLLDERTTVNLSKIPGIGDIPILGELFKSRNVNRTNSELVVLVTPVIVDPVGQAVSSAPPQPAAPIQPLQNGEFDKGLPNSVNKKPETQ
jgi:pilus assembly protein CpaC